MAERMPDRPDRDHPVVAGLVALASVGLAIGLLVAVVFIVGTRVLGVGGGSSSDEAGGAASMYLPTPQSTTASSGPRITLAPGAETSSADVEGDDDESESPESSGPPKKQITLSASTVDAAPMERFDLTGVYPGGEGAILSVQRFEGGHWAEFPATGSVRGETFQIPVQTSQGGVNRFRVVDPEGKVRSGEVRVRIG